MYNTLLSAAVLASTVLAVPIEEAANKASFTIDQVATGKKKFLSGPLEMQSVYNKYARIGAVAPEHVKTAAAAAAVQSGSVSANPQQYDSQYLSPVTVGGKTLNLDFDTGSSDLWVFSTVTPSSESTGHNLYNPSTSGHKLSGYTWDISYGDGSGARGTVYTDKVVVGGVTATSQAVEAATSVSSSFVSDPGDGLLGLAFSSINTVQPQQQTTFFDTVKSSLAAPLFTANLKKGTAGAYTFGYIPSHSGSISYVSVDNSQGFWGFTAGGYGVGTTTTSGSIGSAIADTGTSLLYVPDAAVTAYYRKVSGASYDSSQGGYTFPCSATLPSWSVKIGSGTFTVPGSYMNFAPTDNSGQTCFGGLQSNSGIGLTIFGDIFLKAVLVVFDETQSSPRLGFSAK